MLLGCPATSSLARWVCVGWGLAGQGLEWVVGGGGLWCGGAAQATGKAALLQLARRSLPPTKPFPMSTWPHPGSRLAPPLSMAHAVVGAQGGAGRSTHGLHG